jgi:hypothetical protein
MKERKKETAAEISKNPKPYKTKFEPYTIVTAKIAVDNVA